MEQVIEIDSKELEKLFRSHYEGLSRYAFTFLKDDQLAEDVAQSIFIKLWEKRQDLSVKDAKAYLYRAVHNASLNVLKSKARKVQQENSNNDSLLHVASKEETSDLIMSKELENRVEGAIKVLPAKCQEVFRLSRFKELSYREIADELNISVKTVENHMGKALKHMRSELSDYLPALLITIILSKGW